MSVDQRTTPRWARVPVLLALSALVAYFAACFRHASDDGPPTWAYPGVWKMFTEVDKYHGDVDAEALVGDQWQKVDLEKMFPARWDSGPRYVRGSFRHSQSRMRVLAAAVCGRDDRKPSRVRLYDVKWPVKVGSLEQPKTKVKRTAVVEWSCGATVRLPSGVVL